MAENGRSAPCCPHGADHPTALLDTMPPPSTRNALVAALVVLAHAAVVWLWLTQPTAAPPQTAQAIRAELLAPAPRPALPTSTLPPPDTTSPPAKDVQVPVPADRPNHRIPPLAPPAPAVPQTPVPAVAGPTEPAEQPRPLKSADLAAAPAALPSAPARPATSEAGPPTQEAAPAPVQPPSARAEHLHNPKPAYPPLSKRLGEQGRVVVRARIEVDGTASEAEVHTSSGYDRLDRAARQTVLHWRYVPGTRNGVPEAMWFNVPIQFVLE